MILLNNQFLIRVIPTDEQYYIGQIMHGNRRGSYVLFHGGKCSFIAKSLHCISWTDALALSHDLAELEALQTGEILSAN